MAELLTKCTPGPYEVSSSTLVLALDDKRPLAVICNTLDLSGISGIGILEAMANAQLIARLSPSTMAQVVKALERVISTLTDEHGHAYEALDADMLEQVKSALHLLNAQPSTRKEG